MYDIRKKFGLGDLVTNSDLFENAVDAGVLNPNSNSLQDYESFVVTNPDLVDPGIDVSGLRTTTDANILGNITDFPGIQYEAYNPNRLSDLMNLYSRGLPTLATDTAQIPGAVDTLVDAGSGGGGIGQNQVTGESVAGFDPGVTPGPSGFIGLDPDMDIDPQDFAQEDYGIYDPPELGGVDGMSGGQATPGAEFADQNPYGGTGTMDDLGADTFDTMPQESPVATFGDTTTGLEDYVEGIDLTTGLPETPAIDTTPDAPPSLGFGNAYEEPMSLENVIGTDANVGFVDTPATELGSQINSAFENVKDQGVSAIESFKDALVGLGGKVKEGFDNVVDFGETSIDIGKTLKTGVINYIGTSIFGPVGSILGTALGAIKSDPIDAAVKSGLSKKGYGFDDIGRLTTGPMAGYSVESGFGDGIVDATLDRIDKIENRTAPQTTASIEKVQELYDFLGDVTTVKAAATAPQEDIGAIPGDINTGVAPDGTLPDGTNIMDEFAPSDIQATDPTLDIPDRGRGDVDQDTTDTDPADDFDDGTMTGGVAPSTNKTGIDSFFDAVDEAAGPAPAPQEIPDRNRGDGGGSGAVSDAQAAANQDAARGGQYGGGGGNGGGGGKIVCTMMNESYGFGSFRNKIWLRHSKDLAPEYQKGYHKIFLPLVKLSKNNKFLKTMLEHIAVHRTIDIRQESRGKVHLLGRVYRKILEPICYLVGKYAK